MLGSDQDPTWRDFPQALTETQGARQYVTLFEALFEASVLSDCKNNALWVSSLMALPPPAPGMPSLSRLTTVNLPGSSLTQWASHIQDITSGMRMPLEAAVNCPQADIVGVLNWLESLTPVKYCRLCFRVGKKCRCSNVPCQTPSQGSALWMPPTMSYATMASPTETTASSSVGEVPPLRYPPPGLPPVDPATMSYATMASLPEAMASSSVGGVPPLRYPPVGLPPSNQTPMDMLLAPTTENLLTTAGVGRGGSGWRSPVTGPRTPTAPGPQQVPPLATQQWMPTPGRHEVGQATPYRRQVYLPRHSTGARTATTKANTAPSTSQGHDEMARGDKGARGRSSSQGPRGQTRRDRSSTRGSRKCCQGIYGDNPMDDVSNYVASGWKRDLTHIISCYWVDQVGSLDSKEWEVGIHRFVKAMKDRKDHKWVDIKELTPLKFMPYVAKLFREITGRDLKGLGDYMAWVGLSGYYHWKLSELGQLSACPHLQGQPVPDGPIG